MWWTKILDKMNNKHVRLSKADLDMIKRIRAGQYADNAIEAFPEEPDYEADPKLFIHPLSGAPEPKSRFVMSKWERLRISKYIQAMK